MGHLEAICLSENKGMKKQQILAGKLCENYGLEGDAHVGPWHRQVSLLAMQDIENMRAKGLHNLRYGDFGENLVITGFDLMALGLGSRLRVGNYAELTITQLGKVCHSRCAIYQQTGDCIMPRRGIFTRVLCGGTIAVGDPVEVIEVIARELFQAVVLTISDRGSHVERIDTTSPAVSGLLRQLPIHIYTTETLPDEREQIAERIGHYTDGHSIDLVVVVGRTGFAPRDVTPEAIRDMTEQLTPGLDDAILAASLQKPHTMLGRAVSGMRGKTLLLSLPGSERAASENLEAIIDTLPRGLSKLRGDTVDCAVPPNNKEVNTATEICP